MGGRWGAGDTLKLSTEIFFQIILNEVLKSCENGICLCKFDVKQKIKELVAAASYSFPQK